MTIIAFDWNGEDRTGFGKSILGPVFLHYLDRLHQAITTLDPERDVLAFCTRAGFTIGHLYRRYLAVANQSGFLDDWQSELFFTSRFACCKAVYRRRPELTVDTLLREFRHTNMKALFEAALPHRESAVPDDVLNTPVNTGSLNVLFSGNTPYLKELDADLKRQSDRYENYLHEISDQGRKRLVLIDSGWGATTHRLLETAFSEIRFLSLNFGRTSSDVTRHYPQVFGLMFEEHHKADANPYTAIAEHRHLIEDLLEPKLPSISDIEPTDHGYKPVNWPAEAFAAWPNDEWTSELSSNDHLAGILGYLGEVDARPSQPAIEAHGLEAARQLAEAILFPTRQQVDLLDTAPRSADFGKDEANPVLIRKFDPTAVLPETRIEKALWKQGQRALEGLGVSSDGVKASVKPVAASPPVAVITRTKNRPVMLKRAGESVAAQTYENVIWTVVNDGGDAGEVDEIVFNAGIPADRIRVVHNKVSNGMEAASNIGIRSVDSKYILIHDDDDTLERNFLEETVGFLETNTIYEGVITHSWRVSEFIVNNDYVEEFQKIPYNDWVKSVPLHEMVKTNMFPPISFLFSRAAWEKVGGFNEALPVLGDWDFNLKFLRHYEIGVIPAPLAYYHHRDIQQSGQYSNSLYGAVDKHIAFDAIHRNQTVRDAASRNDIFGLLPFLGAMMRDLRHDIRTSGRETPAEIAKLRSDLEAARTMALERYDVIQSMDQMIKERDSMIDHQRMIIESQIIRKMKLSFHNFIGFLLRNQKNTINN